MSTVKILVVHGSDDDASTVLEKVKELDTKAGPFPHIFLLGALRRDILAKLEGENTPKMYVLSSSCQDCMNDESNLTQSDDIGKNITLLRGAGVYETVDGLRFGYVLYPRGTLRKLASKIRETVDCITQPVDLLLTNEWSERLGSLLNDRIGSNVVDYVTTQVKPRYHITFSSSTKFVEWEPFYWFEEEKERLCRSINVAEFKSGQKWAYAFNLPLEITTMGPKLEKQPGGYPKPVATIENPYLKPVKRKAPKTTEIRGAKRRMGDQQEVRKILPDNCHFCFTNADIQDHMIISVGDLAYLTIARGPLSVPTAEMDFSGHCLLIPIKHIPKPNIGQSNYSDSDIFNELDAYERSIVKMNYREFGMPTIVFEINSNKSIHYHRQILPIPKHLIMKFSDSLKRQVSINNEKYIGNAKLDFREFESPKNPEYIKIRDDPQNNYMQFTVYETSEVEPKIYLSLFQLDDRIDPQFGRRVVAYLLHQPRRIRWNSPLCLQTKNQEIKEVELFQRSYRNYDITNNK